MGFGRSYASEKAPSAHLFKLNLLAILSVKNGEFMVILTISHALSTGIENCDSH